MATRNRSLWYELEIELLDVEPTVWRRLRVPAMLTLAQLHVVLQEALGWEDVHLHLFEIQGVSFGTHPAEAERDESARLEEVLTPGTTFSYVYDFGDYWIHEGSVLCIADTGPPVACLEGENAVPPEDSGGPARFRRRRSGARARRFDLTEINARLAQLRFA